LFASILDGTLTKLERNCLARGNGSSALFCTTILGINLKLVTIGIVKRRHVETTLPAFAVAKEFNALLGGVLVVGETAGIILDPRVFW
jgi:hypothetical protein